jgi:hypothetical protein
VSNFEPVPATGSRRTAIGVLLALVLAMAVVLTMGAAGPLTLRNDPVTGRPIALIEGIPGPETGPVCPLDQRYVNEAPDGLRADVLAAWNQLVADAGTQGVELCVNDGKRSVAQQEREFAAAVEAHGTEELASRYVLPPDESMHVRGTAVDVQPLASAAWVEENGSALGWCRRYENEPWHFEFDQSYVTAGCPALLPSATGY